MALSSACSDSAPSAISHEARVDADNGQIVFVSVVLSAPARAAVEYENEFAGKLRTALSETAVEHVISVVRLRADTAYQYAVAVEDMDGSPRLRSAGEFVAGDLPGALATMRWEASGESSQDLILADYRTTRFVPNPAGDVREHFIVMRDALGYAGRYASRVGVDERILGGVRVQPNCNILAFDNQAKLPEEEGGGLHSRALELRLDFDAKTAVKAWEFSPEPRMYSRLASSAYRLDNGNTLANFGFSPDFATVPIAIIEADAQGREVFRLESIDPPLAESSGRGPERYRAYPGPKSIMGETMLRAPRR